MIDLKSFSPEWLAEKRKKYNRDPGLMENMIYALYLLEQLKLSGLDFIFKGGTSLVLMLNEPQRFSVDIDIIVRHDMIKEELEFHLEKIVGASNFTGMRIDERRSYKQGIPKAHYAFSFQSNVPAKTQKGEVLAQPQKEILLDVLFAENHYPVIVERPVQTEWLVVYGDNVMVKTPDICSIAGDKLTAFAPNTTGVPFHREGINNKGEAIKSEMFMEIIKQAFDVGCLFDLIAILETFKKSYRATAEGEIKYRPERGIKSVDDVLNDTIQTALIVARNTAQVSAEDRVVYGYFTKGIQQFGHYVYTANFRIEQAQVAIAKAAYLASIVLTDAADFEKFDDKKPIAEYMIVHPDYNFLNKQLKFVAKGEALFYWNRTLALIGV
ncbi:nucleotidyltransferase AbiEii toxin of type IV toxin-antitoxin system [Mucilaginibacter gracilis]|uniref:Nucleotidyltransferase AbiEii toxin of type IV toxin-antitoxin system n=1 Tax=Mucilaginibacter gracilis TaxID=423350 RepID=A0A495IZF7_9SPHI|nr:nucleotidyl transferase AbiEii/AbiGii toxin family protein [Mucilaginibacter gracilis]RKR82110.1 nucleotidyltransferase AbiEii toxin of type IV toxin-antitoxin system [Mucilaginibacter gracilis]